MQNKNKSPKEDPDFVEYWHLFIEDISGRANFSSHHLKNLEILIDLLLDYDRLTEFINNNGYTYDSTSKYGYIQKKYEEVVLRQKVVDQIRSYSALLDIKLDKNQNIKEDEDDRW